MGMHQRFLGIFSIVCVFILAACHKKEDITGKEFIQRDVLVDVLVDIHLVDGITNDRKFYRRYDADSIDLLTPILEKYHISKAKFDTTMAIYSKHPDLFDQVYADVLIKLNVMLDQNDKEEEEGEKKVNTPAE